MSDSIEDKEMGSLLHDAYEHLKNGRLKESKLLYQEVLARDGGCLAALNSMGFILYMEGDFRRGEELCEQAVRLYPRDSYAHKGLGLHRARLNKTGEGIEALERAIELDPDFIDAYHDLAFVLHGLGKNDEALRWLEKALARPVEPSRLIMVKRFMARLSPGTP